MDQRLDEQIIEFNKRYQDAVFSNERLLQEKKNRYLTNIKQFKLLNVIDDLKYRSLLISFPQKEIVYLLQKHLIKRKRKR